MAEITVINNEAVKRFEIHLNDAVAFLEYRFHKGDIALMHTLVPDELAGNGLATILAKYALNYAKENKLPVLVYCPFVSGFLKKNPEYNSLVKNNTN